jgi:hypothetical protein
LCFRCRIQQPHQHKKCHHCGHKIRIGDFLGITMMPAAFDNFFTLNDDWCNICICAHIHHLYFTHHKI